MIRNLRGIRSLSDIKKNYSLLPLFGAIGIALGFAVYTGVKTLFYSPEVVLQRKKNAEPWNRYKNKPYHKLMTAPNTSKITKSQAPEF